MSDQFLEGMYDQQAKLAAAAVAEVTRLRASERALQDRLDNMPSTAWALQERVTQLEIELRKLKDKT